jgi:co-chaperonin GroES (HSP10)
MPFDANYGDRVLFAKYSDIDPTIDEKGQLILRESVVLRVLKATALLSKLP